MACYGQKSEEQTSQTTSKSSRCYQPNGLAFGFDEFIATKGNQNKGYHQEERHIQNFQHFNKLLGNDSCCHCVKATTQAGEVGKQLFLFVYNAKDIDKNKELNCDD